MRRRASSGGMLPLPIPSGCIVNNNLRRVQHFFFPQPIGRAACCRSHVPSSCIINGSLRRTINFTSSRQLTGRSPCGDGQVPAACCRSQFRPAVSLTIVFAAFNIFSSLNQSGVLAWRLRRHCPESCTSPLPPTILLRRILREGVRALFGNIL